MALVGDSTNALVEGVSGSEAAVRESLMELVGRFDGRVAVACFASNVARVETVAEVARQHGRQVVLVGRSLRRIFDAARATGYLADMPTPVTEAEAGHLPNDKLLMICTGSQGEPRSALARLARDGHPHLVLEQWVRPRIAVPVHGEIRHMLGHAELAEACQVGYAPVISNGDILRLAPNGPEVVGQAQHGRLAVDGTRVIALGAEDIRVRQRMLWNGTVLLTLVLGPNGGLLAEPQLSAPGLFGEGDTVIRQAVIDEVVDAIEELPAAKRRDDATVSELARRTVRRFVRAERGTNPLTKVHLVRI